MGRKSKAVICKELKQRCAGLLFDYIVHWDNGQFSIQNLFSGKIVMVERAKCKEVLDEYFKKGYAHHGVSMTEYALMWFIDAKKVPVER